MPAHFAESEADVRYETVTAGLEPNALRKILSEAVSLRSAFAHL